MSTFREKVSGFIQTIKSNKKLSVLAVLVLVAAIPFTVYLAQQVAEIRQNANTNQASIFVNPTKAKPGDTLKVSWTLAQAPSQAVTVDISPTTVVQGVPLKLKWTYTSGTPGNKDLFVIEHPTHLQMIYTHNCSETPAEGTSPRTTGECTVQTTNFSPGTHKIKFYSRTGNNAILAAQYDITVTQAPTPVPGKCAPRPNIVRNVSVDNTAKTVTVRATVGTNTSTPTNKLISVQFTRISNAEVHWVNPANNQTVIIKNDSPADAKKITFPANTQSVTFVEKRIACGAVTVEYTWIDDCGTFPDFSGAGTGPTGLTCDATPTPTRTQTYNLPSWNLFQKAFAQQANPLDNHTPPRSGTLVRECTTADNQSCISLGYQRGCSYVRTSSTSDTGASLVCIYGPSQQTCVGGEVNTCAGATNGCKPIPDMKTCLYSANQSCTARELADAKDKGYEGCVVTNNKVEGQYISQFLYATNANGCNTVDTQNCQNRGYSTCTVDATSHLPVCSAPTGNPSCTGYDEDFCASFGQVCSLTAQGQRKCTKQAVTPRTFIDASPRSCTVGADGKCSATISWRVNSNLPDVTVKTYVANGAEQPFAAGPSGSKVSPSVTVQGVAFRLYSGTNLLDSVFVEGSTTGPTGTITPSTAPSTLTGAETLQLFTTGYDDVRFETPGPIGEKLYLNCQAAPATTPIAIGECSYALPNNTRPGTYFFRMLAADGTTVLGESPLITVTTTIKPTPPPLPLASLSASVKLNGIGTPSGNIAPKHPVRPTLITLFDAKNNPVFSYAGKVTYDEVSGTFRGTFGDWLPCPPNIPCVFPGGGTIQPPPPPIGDPRVQLTMLSAAAQKGTPTQVQFQYALAQPGPNDLFSVYKEESLPQPGDIYKRAPLLFLPDDQEKARVINFYASTCLATPNNQTRSSGACNIDTTNYASGRYSVRLFANNGFTDRLAITEFIVTDDSSETEVATETRSDFPVPTYTPYIFSCNSNADCPLTAVPPGFTCFKEPNSNYPGSCRPADTACAQVMTRACTKEETPCANGMCVQEKCDYFPNRCVVPPGWSIEGEKRESMPFPEGVYTVKVWTPQFLRKQIPGIVTIKPNEPLTLPSLTLSTGDINEDNILNILDYNLLVTCFGKKISSDNCKASPHFTDSINPLADLNDDGVVDGTDYNLFIRSIVTQTGD